ncbi:MAG: c-type cytochrome, partial [Pseudomonadales bacterium]
RSAFGVASGIPAQDGNVIRGGRILTYKLGATGSLPTPPMPEALPTPPPMTASADTVDQGELLYHQNCSVCHGGGAVSSGVLPDLRYMDEQTHQIFQGIVLGGAYKEKGMVSFSHVLDSEGAEAIHAYLIKRGHDAIEERRLLAEQSQSDSAPAGG